MERTSSFINVSTTKRRRSPVCTPTGYTPRQKKLCKDTYRKWSPSCKVELHAAVKDATSRGMRNESQQFWEFVSGNLSTPHSADACRRFHKRRLQLDDAFRESDKENKDTSLGTPFTSSVSTQTDVTLPIHCIIQSTEPEHPTFQKILDIRATSSDAAKILHQENLKRLSCSGGLSEGARQELALTVLYGSTDDIVAQVCDVLKDNVTRRLLDEAEEVVCKLAANPSKYDVEHKSSCLFKKDVEDLKSFQFVDIVMEITSHHSLLGQLLLRTCMPVSAIGNSIETERAVKKVCLSYGILMQNRNKDMSKVQRTLTSVIAEQHVHQKVYDALQPIGVCLSHSSMLHLVDLFRGYFNKQLIDHVKRGKRLRLVGDNVDVKIGVKHERKDKHDHLVHWFGSLALLDEPLFIHLSDVKPQSDLMTAPVELFLPSQFDITMLLSNFSIHVGRIALKHMPFFQFLHKVLPNYIKGPLSDQLAKKTTIIPLQCLPYNETSYADCIHILHFYQNLVDNIYQECQQDVPLGRVHIGGDQKTRERFSGAKRLLGGSLTPTERYESLGPITFELFHLKMKFLSVVYKLLYKEDSDEMGTMEAEKVRLSRKSVHPDVKNYYEPDREFFYHFFEAYVLEALCVFFDMDDVNSAPKQHVPENVHDYDNEQLLAWFKNIMYEFLKFHNFDRITYGPQQTRVVVNEDKFVTMPDGTRQMKHVQVLHNVEEDYLYNYGRNVLELGLLFTELEDCCKLPDRDRLLAIIKYMMVLFRGHSTLAKYNLELLRFLMHQTCTLSEREAHESMYSLLVNTQGHVDSHIPADLMMEHNVKILKQTIKGLGSNKIKTEVIEKRTAADSAFHDIADNYFVAVGAVIRAHKPKIQSASHEIQQIVHDIHSSQPFSMYLPGRKFDKFKKIKPLLATCDYGAMTKWITKNKTKYTQEIGQ